MFGRHTGTLRVWYQIGYEDWTQAWNLTGEQDTAWNSSTVMIPYSYKLSYYGFRYFTNTFLRVLVGFRVKVHEFLERSWVFDIKTHKCLVGFE